MSKTKLHTSNDAFRALHVLCDGSRGKRPIRVERQQLLDLLMDHSALIRALGADKVENPPDLLD